MLVVGLTGGMASGKNTVSKMLEELGARIIDADAISRELVEQGKEAWQDIIKEFGAGILSPDGAIDRKKLGSIVFGSEEKRALLNKILHPKIIEEEHRRIEQFRNEDPGALVVVNAALLIESKNYLNVDCLVIIDSDEEEMINRAMERDKLSRHEALGRLRAQINSKERLKYADYIIENKGSLEDLLGKARSLFEQLKVKALT